MGKSVSIFIRSYSKDFDFLKYCIRSIELYCSGFLEVVIVVPASDISELRSIVSGKNIKTFGTTPRAEGYLDQQITKLEAYKYCQGEYILYVDSDVVFHTPTTPENFFDGASPIVLKTKYSSLDDNARVWQGITARAIGFEPQWEYMRRLPLIFSAKTLKNIAKDYPNLIGYVEAARNREFSEFNFIGAYAEACEGDGYAFIDTEEFLPSAVTEQFWSWGGLTKDVISRIEKHLNL